MAIAFTLLILQRQFTYQSQSHVEKRFINAHLPQVLYKLQHAIFSQWAAAHVSSLWNAIVNHTKDDQKLIDHANDKQQKTYFTTY